MDFGEVPIEQATGAVLAHSLKRDSLVFRKGRVLSAEDVAALDKIGVRSVMAAKLAPTDIGEDAAAARIAAAVAGQGVTIDHAVTGRANIFAASKGVLVYEPSRLDALNLIHESITIAALSPFDVVAARRMVATVKIIPYASPESAVSEVERSARQGEPLFRVAAFVGRKVAVIQTTLPSVKASVLDKTSRVIAGRVEHIGAHLIGERHCVHETAAVAEAIAACKAEGADMLLVVGASAITDRRDVIPAAIVRAGGRIEHLGMPVDPGNLLLLAELDPMTPVLGMPGCVRSPKLNGADWVMERLGAGIAVTAGDIKRMGAGGLLMEIDTRPMPREKTAEDS